METVETVKTLETLETLETVETVETVDTVETVRLNRLNRLKIWKSISHFNSVCDKLKARDAGASKNWGLITQHQKKDNKNKIAGV